MDCYLLISLVFVFGTLVELALVLLTKQTKQILMRRLGTISSAPTNPLSCPIQDLEVTPLSNRIRSIETGCQKRHIWKPGMVIPLTEEGMSEHINKTTRTNIIQSIFKELSTANKLDFLAFVVFNVSYITFNAIYFCEFMR